jgi:glyoxylase-like metal-dependent hydrolase (beta-lactamase superfamily II)
MPRWLRWAIGILAVLVVVGGGAYYWLVGDGDPPRSITAFPIDIERLRALATEMPGDRPSEIRVERVAAFDFPAVASVGGDGWDIRPMGAYSYQVIAPGGTIIIDAALTAAQGSNLGARIDDDAFARMNVAMEAASQIVITHEHPDHIGGIVAYPAPDDIRSQLRLTAEQVAEPTRYGAFTVPAPPLLEAYTPLSYDTATAIAPGVALMKAAGHTPGTQLIFVTLANGKEVLFIGDIGWSLRNIETGKGRPRLLSQFMLGEDREAVFAQLAALKALHGSEPALAIVPGHDSSAIDALVADGTLLAGFAL